MNRVTCCVLRAAYVLRAARDASRLARYLAALLALWLLTACSLAQDVTPPPGFENTSLLAPTPTEVDELSFPATTPSTARGAEIYAENCTRCHGVSGGGDGPVASQIEFPVPRFDDPDLAFTTTPQRWFSIITRGNLERLMPPWADSISESDRWHLVAYLYRLSASSARLEAGQTVYEANCAGCHGERGAGDGPDAPAPVADFTDQQFMAAKSNRDFFAALTDDAGGGHPLGDKLSEQELRSVVDYVRSFSFSAEAPAISRGTVTGSITHGTQGAAVPADQPVELHIFDNFQETETLTTTIDGAGTFEFTDIELLPGRALIVSSRYDDVLYASDIGEVSEAAALYDLPITIYDTTTEPSNIVIERMHIVLEFGTGALQVGELITLSNGGDRTFVASTPGGPTSTFPLPAGFTGLSFQDGELGDRYQPMADGFADTVPITPGASTRQMLFSYRLPYSGSLAFTQPLQYAAQNIDVLLPHSGVTLGGANVVDQGVNEVQGTAFRSYTLSNLGAGDTIAFTIHGQPAAASANTSPAPTSGAINQRTLLVGGLSLGLALAIIAYWWVEHRAAHAPAATPQRNISHDRLLQAIAELDDEFEAGEISEAGYRAKREKLKARLKASMQ